MMKWSFWVWSGVFAMENERVIVSPSLVVTVMSTYCPAQNLIGVFELDLDGPDVMGQACLAVIRPLKSLTAMDFDSSSSSKFRSSITMSSCGQRPAQQDAALFPLAVAEREGRVFQQLDIAFDQVAFAGRTLAFLAAMRQRDALAEGGVQNRFAVFDLELDADGLQADGVGI